MTSDSTKRETRRDWFAVGRGIFSTEFFEGDEFSRRDAWLWLVANAAWKTHHVRTRGGVIELQRGQVPVAREHLATVWKWTPKRVRIYLAQLEAAGMLKLGQSNGHFANVATISNYELFQAVLLDREPVVGPVEGQSEASEGPHRTRVTRKPIVEGAAKSNFDSAEGD